MEYGSIGRGAHGGTSRALLRQNGRQPKIEANLSENVQLDTLAFVHRTKRKKTLLMGFLHFKSLNKSRQPQIIIKLRIVCKHFVFSCAKKKEANRTLRKKNSTQIKWNGSQPQKQHFRLNVM